MRFREALGRISISRMVGLSHPHGGGARTTSSIRPQCPLLVLQRWTDDSGMTHARVLLPTTEHILRTECRRRDLTPDWSSLSARPIDCDECLEAVDRALIAHQTSYG